MKFTKEEACEKLKGKLTNDGKKPLRMSERSIAQDVETLLSVLGEEDETELDDFVAKYLPIFESANSNVEYDTSLRVKEAKEAMEESKRKEKAKEPITTPKKVDANATDTNQVILDKLASLENEIAEAKRSKTISDKTKDLRKAVKDKGVKNEGWIESAISMFPINEDVDVNEQAESLVKLYNQQNSETDTPFTPKTPSTPPDKDPFENVKALKKQLDEQDKNVI